MKKIFSLTILFTVSSTVIALAYLYIGTPAKEIAEELAGKTWKFNSLVSDDATTGHYVSTIYENAEYTFAADHTFTGRFFEMPVSGTWELSNDILILNKNTDKEEAYTISTANSKIFVLKTTEKGKTVSLQFVKL